MASLRKKIDFAVILRVKNANPNGDPSNGNRPRTDYNGVGEISDVCLKRKIRDRLQESGKSIFVQSDDLRNDDASSLRERAENKLGKKLGSSETLALACATWFDVRAFGQLFAFARKKGKNEEESGGGSVSIPIRGPVTVHSAFSIGPVEVTTTQITKSVSNDGDGGKRGPDTMGMKHRVDGGIYVFCGSMNPQLAERTGFAEEDAIAIKNILPMLFENDASSARPEGSMDVLKVFWWEHNSKSGQYSSAKVHSSLTVKADGSYVLDHLRGLECQEVDGF